MMLITYNTSVCEATQYNTTHAHVLSVIELIITSNQEQKLQLCESNIQNLNETLNNGD